MKMGGMRRTLLPLGFAVLVLVSCGGDKAASTTTTRAAAGGGATTTTTAGAATGGAATGGKDFEVVQGKGDGTVAIKGLKFTTADVKVKVGQTVEWTNQDDFGHTSTGDNKEWDSTTIAPHATAVVRFNKAGTYTYHCEIHRQMKATVVVE